MSVVFPDRSRRRSDELSALIESETFFNILFFIAKTDVSKIDIAAEPDARHRADARVFFLVQEFENARCGNRANPQSELRLLKMSAIGLISLPRYSTKT